MSTCNKWKKTNVPFIYDDSVTTTMPEDRTTISAKMHHWQINGEQKISYHGDLKKIGVVVSNHN